MLTKREKLFKFRKRLGHYFLKQHSESVTTFIGGCQRSGTNFFIRVLNHCKVTECYLENDDEAFDNYMLKNYDKIKQLVSKSKAQVVVFKSICDSQKINELFTNLPNSKAIWIFRHYNDVVNSALRNFKEHRKYLYYMLYEPIIARWRIENVTKEDLELVEKYYKQGIDDASSSALVWWLRNKLFFQQHLDKNSKLLMVRYENLVTQPVKEFERVFNFLGIYCDVKVTRIAHTKSISKNSPPNIDPEIKMLCEELFIRLVQFYESRYDFM